MSAIAKQLINELRNAPESFQLISEHEVKRIVGISYSTILYGKNGGLKKGDVLISGWGNGNGWVERNILRTSIISVYIKGQEIEINPFRQELENEVYEWLANVPLNHLISQ